VPVFLSDRAVATYGVRLFEVITSSCIGNTVNEDPTSRSDWQSIFAPAANYRALLSLTRVAVASGKTAVIGIAFRETSILIITLTVVLNVGKISAKVHVASHRASNCANGVSTKKHSQ